MRRMYDFKCEQNHQREALVDETVKELPCEECDGVASRIISPTTIYLEPFSGVYPSATAKWAKQRAEKLAVEKKTKANHG
jgi:hypothetical protein